MYRRNKDEETKDDLVPHVNKNGILKLLLRFV